MKANIEEPPRLGRGARRELNDRDCCISFNSAGTIGKSSARLKLDLLLERRPASVASSLAPWRAARQVFNCDVDGPGRTPTLISQPDGQNASLSA